MPINQSIISFFARRKYKIYPQNMQTTGKSTSGVDPLNLIQLKYLAQYISKQVLMEKSKLGFDPTAVPKDIILPDVSDLPSEIDYVFVYPKNSMEIKEKKYACALTFTDQETTIDILLKKVMTEATFPIPQCKSYHFLFENRKLDRSIQVKDLKKQLLRTKLNGVFFVLQGSNYQQQYIDENAVIDYFKWNIPVQPAQLEKSKFYVKFNFTLQGCLNTETIYVYFRNTDTGKSLILRLIEEIKAEFKIQLSYPPKQVYVYGPNKSKDQLFENMQLVAQRIYHNTAIFVEFKNPNNIPLVRPKVGNNNSWIVIYKENEKGSTKIRYDQISYMTFAELYKTRLEVKGAERKKDAVYCLKIMDQIIKPYEKLNVAQAYFKNKDPKVDISIVGKVVTEKMIFYRVIPNLCIKKGRQFKLEELTVPENQENQRAFCRQVISQRAIKSPIEYFRNKQHVEPILIYTSELKYIDLTTGQEKVIYQSLNQNLRDTPILSIDEKEFQKEWWLRFSSTLLKHLKETVTAPFQTWRGVTYIPEITQQDVKNKKIFTYRQFTSTSIFIKTAIKFAKGDGSKIVKQPYQLFSFKTKTAKEILSYSLFTNEGEILIEPFTEFQLVGITNQIYDKQKFTVYRLEEVLTSKQLPGERANFVVWIDDKPNQPQAIWNKLKRPSETTIFEQPKSNIQLNGWLQRNRLLFEDETVKILFITNMTRKEGNTINELAGIEAATLIRTYSATAPIFFYIGDIEKARNKLNHSMLNMNTISIGNQPIHVQTFLRTYLTND